ncbi:MAG: DUF1573 domain-containing protein [Candidatus Promineifilaceae bacterium]
MNRTERRQQTQRRARRKQTIAIAILVIALLLVAGSLYAYFSESQTATVELDYSPEDIVYDQPIHAIHEMGEGPPIPFLPSDQAQPAIAVSEKSYDFGSIGPADIVERTFVIFNTGNAPLTISRAYTTCGCTEADITARSIPAGKVAEVTITFNAGFHDTAGQTVRRGLLIENNDPRQSQAEIWIEASVRNS